MYMGRFVKKYKRVLTVVAPALIGGLYLLLCFASIRQSIWFDESYSAYLIRFDFDDILKYTAADVHPPLYYFFLKTWSLIFGYTDFALRAMSAFFGALAILFAFMWLKYKYGKAAAILGALFLAISPNFIRYGQEMRMYTMIAAIVFAATLVLQFAIDNKSKKWWVIYAVLVALGMYTHYFCAFAWIAHVVYLLFIYGKDFFKEKKFTVYILSVLMYLPWIPGLITQVSTVQRSGFWVGDTSVSKFSNFFTETFLYEQSGEVKNWMFILFAVMVALFIGLSFRYRKQLKLLLCMTIVPIVSLILISMPPLQSMFVPRYMLYSMCAIAMIVGVDLVLLARELVAKIPKGKKSHKYSLLSSATCAICIAVFLLGSGLGLNSVYAKTNYNFETNTRPVSKDVFADILVMSGENNLPIITENIWIYFDLSFYGTEDHPVYFLDESTEYEYGSLLPLQDNDLGKIINLDEFMKDHPKVIFVGQPSSDSKLNFPCEECTQTELMVMGHDDGTGSKFQAAVYEK